MVSMIEFNPNMGIWSPLTFWIVVVSVILTLGFTAVVFIGGIGDLRYLLRSFDEGETDDLDDGRVSPSDESLNDTRRPADRS